MKIVEPKKCNIFTAIYFVSSVRPICDYASVHKIIFLTNLAEYMVICRYINIWNSNFMVVQVAIQKLKDQDI
jgi:hypothetical protein